ncbi:hypothetical protein NDU88_006948 [Pleurodeles waltl]|uniref:Uncharacterized protein n=1 Tax=Pleurodeles waltl TaxID=8319 RepID=A0AAV7PJU3_PLEWA|nr:hypothetical protein NDU88_006948 [Pleurodeles waltl]
MEKLLILLDNSQRTREKALLVSLEALKPVSGRFLKHTLDDFQELGAWLPHKPCDVIRVSGGTPDPGDGGQGNQKGIPLPCSSPCRHNSLIVGRRTHKMAIYEDDVSLALLAELEQYRAMLKIAHNQSQALNLSEHGRGLKQKF